MNIIGISSVLVFDRANQAVGVEPPLAGTGRLFLGHRCGGVVPQSLKRGIWCSRPWNLAIDD